MADDAVSPASEYDCAVARHAGHYAAVVQRAGPQLRGAGKADNGQVQLRALKTLGLEVGNIFAALESAAQRGCTEWLLPLADYLWDWLDLASRFRDMLTAYQQLRDCAQRLANAELASAARLGLGLAHYRLGNPERALETLLAGPAWLNQRHLAVALSLLGFVDEDRADYDAAEARHQEALGLYRELCDRAGEGHALNNLANIRHDRTDYAQAQLLHEQAMALRRATGDLCGEAASLNNLANILRRQLRYEEARELYERALVINRETGNHSWQAVNLSNLANVAMDTGQLEAAADFTRASMAIDRETGDRRGYVTSLFQLGALARADGRYDEAAAWLEECLTLTREVGSRTWEAVTFVALAGVERLRGNLLRAQELGRAALAIQQETGDSHGAVASLTILGKVALLQQDLAAAGECFRQALANPEEPGERPYETLAASGALLARLADAAQPGLALSAAIALHGAQAAAARRGFRFNPEEQRTLQAACDSLRAAVAAGWLDRELYAAAVAEAAELDLSVLAARTCRALVRAEADGAATSVA